MTLSKVRLLGFSIWAIYNQRPLVDLSKTLFSNSYPHNHHSHQIEMESQNQQSTNCHFEKFQSII